MIEIALESETDFDGWRRAARRLCAAGVDSQSVRWRTPGEPAGLLVGDPAPDGPDGPVTASRRFVDLARRAVHLRDPQRFARLYALLMRLQVRAGVLDDLSDPDAAWLAHADKAIRRDVHKMHAFVRFRKAGEDAGGRERFAAWFEPEHRILALAAPFFMRRFPSMDWVIATPDGSAAWDGEALRYGPASDWSAVPDEDAVEDQWRMYFKAIFNPARLKVSAMMSEMPKKYWKNLPESDLIPGMIAAAGRRASAMQDQAPGAPNPLSARLAERRATAVDQAAAAPASLDEARSAAARCERCPLHCGASQTVFGEGPSRAGLMIVGEQPGDQEDLAGRPFVGPAGAVLDTGLEATGLLRSKAYVTNAVKHFKYERRGKRRLHKRPVSGEIDQCRWWLDLERRFVAPKVIVTLGASAAHGVLGGPVRLEDIRGLVVEHGGAKVIATVHPAYLLRLTDPARRAGETARLHGDLARAKALLEAEAAV